jgi:hypothetical protein
VANVTPRPLYPQERDPVSIVQEAGWAPGPVWTDAKNLAPHRNDNDNKTAIRKHAKGKISVTVSRMYPTGGPKAQLADSWLRDTIIQLFRGNRFSTILKIFYTLFFFL